MDYLFSSIRQRKHRKEVIIMKKLFLMSTFALMAVFSGQVNARSSCETKCPYARAAFTQKAPVFVQNTQATLTSTSRETVIKELELI
jgi:hypothetical protein